MLQGQGSVCPRLGAAALGGGTVCPRLRVPLLWGTACPEINSLSDVLSPACRGRTSSRGCTGRGGGFQQILDTPPNSSPTVAPAVGITASPTGRGKVLGHKSPQGPWQAQAASWRGAAQVKGSTESLARFPAGAGMLLPGDSPHPSTLPVLPSLTGHQGPQLTRVSRLEPPAPPAGVPSAPPSR